MSYIIYITGYPGSGKLTVANRIANEEMKDATVIDSHSISNIIYHRCSRQVIQTKDSFEDCQSLANKIAKNDFDKEYLFKALKSIAEKAFNLSPVNISDGEAPSESHYKLVEEIRDKIFELIASYPEENYIFTNKLYKGNAFHDKLIKQVKGLCNASRHFYGFKLIVNPSDLVDRVAQSDRKRNGKLINPDLLKSEINTRTLTDDCDFREVSPQPSSAISASLIAGTVRGKQIKINTASPEMALKS